MSEQNRCAFCISAHGAALERLKVPASEIEKIRVGEATDARLAAILKVAVALTRDSHGVDEWGLKSLEAAGLDRAAQIEVVEVAAYFNGFNRVLDAFDVRPPA